MESQHPNQIANPPVVDVENIAASTECTGLIPNGVENEDEAADYSQLYAIHPSKPTKPEP